MMRSLKTRGHYALLVPAKSLVGHNHFTRLTKRQNKPHDLDKHLDRPTLLTWSLLDTRLATAYKCRICLLSAWSGMRRLQAASSAVPCLLVIVGALVGLPVGKLGEVSSQSVTLCTALKLIDCLQSQNFDEKLALVWADEFEGPNGTQFREKDRNTDWVAANVVANPNITLEQFTEQAVQVTACPAGGGAGGDNGTGCLRIDAYRRSAGQLDNDEKYAAPSGDVDVEQPYSSGMLQSWNRRCFTGGYFEVRVLLPEGALSRPGLIPGVHLVGNLARWGWARSTAGVWPYSYDKCYRSGSPPSGDVADAQKLTRCAPMARRGRGAPEISVFEVRHGVYGSEQGEEGVAALLTGLKVAPPLPRGVDWQVNRSSAIDDATAKDKIDAYQDNSLGQHVSSLKRQQDMQWRRAQLAPLSAGLACLGANTAPNPQRGPYSVGPGARPGTASYDYFSAATSLDAQSFGATWHTFGVWWEPNELLRWYVDGALVAQLDNRALQEAVSDTGELILERRIPVEPMYIGLYLQVDALLQDFAAFSDLENGTSLWVDYVRVYQRTNNSSNSAEASSCSPAGYPTAEYIACRQQLFYTQGHAGVMSTSTAICPSTQASNYVWISVGVLGGFALLLTFGLAIFSWADTRHRAKQAAVLENLLHKEYDQESD